MLTTWLSNVRSRRLGSLERVCSGGPNTGPGDGTTSWCTRAFATRFEGARLRGKLEWKPQRQRSETPRGRSLQPICLAQTDSKPWAKLAHDDGPNVRLRRNKIRRAAPAADRRLDILGDGLHSAGKRWVTWTQICLSWSLADTAQNRRLTRRREVFSSAGSSLLLVAPLQCHKRSAAGI